MPISLPSSRTSACGGAPSSANAVSLALASVGTGTGGAALGDLRSAGFVSATAGAGSSPSPSPDAAAAWANRSRQSTRPRQTSAATCLGYCVDNSWVTQFLEDDIAHYFVTPGDFTTRRSRPNCDFVDGAPTSPPAPPRWGRTASAQSEWDRPRHDQHLLRGVLPRSLAATSPQIPLGNLVFGLRIVEPRFPFFFAKYERTDSNLASLPQVGASICPRAEVIM